MSWAAVAAAEGTEARSVADEPGRARERDLVRRAAKGDVGAFEVLYRENAGRVYGLCLRLTGSPQRSEELAQDAFVRAWQKLDSFEGRSAFSSWLYTLTTNLVFSDRRSRNRRELNEVLTDDPEVFAPGTTPAGGEAGMDLDTALARLPDGARRVFVLHDIEGYRHDEIAAQMGVATGTSKAQLHRARKLLRQALAT